MATGTSYYIDVTGSYCSLTDGPVPFTETFSTEGWTPFWEEKWPDGSPIYPRHEPASDIWQCPYCKAKHWIEDKELNCQKCGAPRDI